MKINLYNDKVFIAVVSIIIIAIPFIFAVLKEIVNFINYVVWEIE